VEKTKLGITVGLLGAAIFFLGLINLIALIIVAGYVLLFETNEWLKRSAVKAVAIVIGFALISVLISFGNDIFGFFNSFFDLAHSSFRFGYPLKLNDFISTLASAVEKLIFLVLGIKALKQESISIEMIDKIVNRNM
jgi:hypothetical protein